MKAKLQAMASNYGFGISVENLVSDLYWNLVAEGENSCIVNERYLEVNGVTYQLCKTRSKGHWTVKEI